MRGLGSGGAFRGGGGEDQDDFCARRHQAGTAVNIGILASHEGTTMQAVADACRKGDLSARIAIVISNNTDSMALKRAARAGIKSAYLSRTNCPCPEELDANICTHLVSERVDIVLLAGYLKKVGPITLTKFRGRIFNTHPALLPKYGGKGMYGRHVHKAVLEAGELETGISVHLVDAEYDTGPVVAQCRVPVERGDSVETLSARVHERERLFVVEVLGNMADNTIQLPFRTDI